MSNETKKATVVATGEQLNVYKLNNGNWYDFDAMGASKPATSSTGKKEFKNEELIIR